MSIRMVALDLDGTTLNSRREITERTRRSFDRAAGMGVHIVVSTGRTFTALPPQLYEIPSIQYAITSNGAHINEMSTGKSIFDAFLSPRAVREVAELYRKLGCDMEVFIDGKAFIDESYYNQIKEHGLEYRSAEYVLWSRKPVRDIAQKMLDNADRIENVNLCFSTIEKLEEARAQVEALPEATITSSFQNSLEVGGPNTSKKAALIELMEMLGIDRSELMCCGDAPNDIAMIEFAGIGVAVGNAWGGTAEHADFITGTNDEDGVAQAIEKFVL